jgi:hypothetical protein
MLVGKSSLKTWLWVAMPEIQNKICNNWSLNTNLGHSSKYNCDTDTDSDSDTVIDWKILWKIADQTLERKFFSLTYRFRNTYDLRQLEALFGKNLGQNISLRSRIRICIRIRKKFGSESETEKNEFGSTTLWLCSRRKMRVFIVASCYSTDSELLL